MAATNPIYIGLVTSEVFETVDPHIFYKDIEPELETSKNGKLIQNNERYKTIDMLTHPIVTTDLNFIKKCGITVLKNAVFIDDLDLLLETFKPFDLTDFTCTYGYKTKSELHISHFTLDYDVPIPSIIPQPSSKKVDAFEYSVNSINSVLVIAKFYEGLPLNGHNTCGQHPYPAALNGEIATKIIENEYPEKLEIMIKNVSYDLIKIGLVQIIITGTYGYIIKQPKIDILCDIMDNLQI